MKEITIDVWTIVSELIRRVPGLLIDRDSFLNTAFSNKLNRKQLESLILEGNYRDIPIEILDSVADTYISKTRLSTTSASFLAGLPSSLPALPATVTADVTQSFAFYIRIAQQLAYIYGETTNFTSMKNKDRMTKILLYIGTMFGIETASQVLALVSRNAGEILSKKFGEVAVTKVLKGIPWKVAKTIAKLLGIKLTKEVAQKGIAKVLPILGGIVSGALTYTTFGPMAKKLQTSLRSSIQATEEQVIEIYETVSSESDEEIAASVNKSIDKILS